MQNKRQGALAEQKACEFLQTKGLSLLQKNYRCILGEIDLIMRDRDDIVFVEVRSRSRKDYGTALESINQRKIKKLIRAATHFLQIKQWLNKMNSRFDVVVMHDINHQLEMEWIKNAFSVESE